jgi:dolichol kinase
MKKEVVVRRLVHCLIALAPLYFLLPDDLPIIGLRRWVLLIAFIVGIGAFDAWRRYKGITFMGLRPHERKGIASFAWAAAGVTFVLWLITQDIATASLVSMALVDPLAGELRGKYGKKSWPVGVSGLAYFVLALTVMALWGDHTMSQSLILATVGAVVAIPSELAKMRYLDDDFTMLVFPAAAMSLIAWFLW